MTGDEDDEATPAILVEKFQFGQASLMSEDGVDSRVIVYTLGVPASIESDGAIEVLDDAPQAFAFIVMGDLRLLLDKAHEFLGKTGL